MIASTTPTKDYISNFSPYRHHHHHHHQQHSTPPRLISTSNELSSYDSPMLTPSPLRQPSSLFATQLRSGLSDQNDFFLQSPYKSPVPTNHVHSFYASKPQPITPDDHEGSIFLSSSPTSFSPFFPASLSQPLRTPVKQIHRRPSPSALSVNPLNNTTPSDTLSPVTRVGVGTKRKSTPHSTPIRLHSLTPLMISSQKCIAKDKTMLDCLAPLQAPKFHNGTVTPRSNAETDAHLKRQTATLTRLKLTDFSEAENDLGGFDNDSGCEIDDEERGEALFIPSLRLQSKGKGKEKEEVAEAISPGGGHVIKRRARRRPLSAELLESVRQSPSPSKGLTINMNIQRPRNSGIVFPSAPHLRQRTASGSSSSESGSPLPRRRVGTSRPCPPKIALTTQATSRLPLSRQDSVSSATLFFGPAIPQTTSSASALRSRTNTLSPATSDVPRVDHERPKVVNRHSYAGPGASLSSFKAWNTFQTREDSCSPKSSPPPMSESHSRDHGYFDRDVFCGDVPHDSSFVFSVTGTPSPRAKMTRTTLPTKYKPRDSGVVLTDDDNMHLHAMPLTSTSVESMQSDNLVTPGFEPEVSSGWPSVFVKGTDDIGHADGLDVDAFIMRTLATASKGAHNIKKKKVPGTPVKKVKTTYLAGGARPWQSAVAEKVGLRVDWDAKRTKAPRKSLPAAFPSVGKKATRHALDQTTDSEDDEESPVMRRERYTGLGVGRPGDATSKPQDENPLITRTRWLMRRSSSGAFSSGSESLSSSGTPTKAKGKGAKLLQTRPYTSSQLSPTSKSTFARSISGSSSGSATTQNSPSLPSTRQFPTASAACQHSLPFLHRFPERFNEDQPGRFEHDFFEEDELGSGEFGKVIKVRSKKGSDGEVYAVKKSKRFEGPRHRAQLREEVQILQHLSQVASSSPLIEGNRHPNVLGYIDSWEEDEVLYIQTELCESGNLAQFLWEFGRVYPKLSEDRVWKIVVDLSNGLRFIHDAGVIHLDLKPSNVFVTGEGRFKIGDFGMASLWPRPKALETGGVGFEREGDKLYLAPEVLQGRYSKAADVFSFGMTILESATNIVVPDQGEAWHRLRREDFSQVDLDSSPELLGIIRQMMRTDPSSRVSVHGICHHPVVSRAREIMERVEQTAKQAGTTLFAASPLGSVHEGFLDEILGRSMDVEIML